MTDLLQHLPMVPIVAPLVAAATILFLTERSRRIRIAIAGLSMFVQLCAAIALLTLTTSAFPDVWTRGVGVYAIGAWQPPFGIVLVIDRLTGMMLTLTAVVGLAAFVNSLAYWDRVGPHFHTLFQLLLMGVNGAFLTGDLFNLFVFFEILLAASYGLLLHGSSTQRVKVSLHYIIVNLVGSLLFLIGVSLVYGVTGSLNIAELPAATSQLAGKERALFDAATSILAVAFLIKAGAWPLNFWLPGTYAAAAAPVAAVFGILTKVGVYVLLRVGSLGAGADVLAAIEGPAMLRPELFRGGMYYLGILTMGYGIFGMLAAQHLARLVAFSAIVSSGLLLTVIGLDIPALMAPALFYLIGSVLATAAFFMLAGMTERAWRSPAQGSSPQAATPEPEVPPHYVPFGVRRTPALHSQDDEVGVAIPAAMAFMGIMFAFCVLLVTGSPPLSGFVAKFALLSAAFHAADDAALAGPLWVLAGVTLATGLASLVALTRIGMRLFWSVTGRNTPRLRVLEAGPVAVLVVLCIMLTVAAGPVMAFLDEAAASLRAPQIYIETVLAGKEVL
ncbi:MAG TPA: monovalent cation/H+ antiporter subunit D [Steroidobacteraceae bacterium]|nr:monovalent cation/H+ antiporter subunit D [Steroidobacteraceae bacterium]HNS27352.1 monovalent cation/H+ antiporter subunit D [Steroidobacteraceae bacterium]